MTPTTTLAIACALTLGVAATAPSAPRPQRGQTQPEPGRHPAGFVHDGPRLGTLCRWRRAPAAEGRVHRVQHVTYPDGREEVVLDVHYDNSPKNRWNPAPDKEVF